MKRKAVVSIVLAAALLAACSSSQTGKKGSAASSEKSAEANETKGSEVLDPSTITDDEDTLRDAVDSQTEDLKNRLTVQSQTLTSEIDSYDAYKENVDKVEEFYDTVVTETNKTLILLRKDSSAYAAALLASDRDQDDIYNDLDDIVDDVYDGGCDDISDDIYDGLMDDMRDAFYDGVLDDSDVTDDYDEWSDLSSNEYDMLSEHQSDVYDLISDAASDIYDFCSDLESDVYSGDMDDAQEDIDDFNADVEKLENGSDESAEETVSEDAESSAETESAQTADTGSDTNENVSMQTSNEYSSVIPAVSDYFTETPYENVESDAGLAVMWDTCNMDEVHAFVTALKDKGFTMNPSEISTGTLYQYAATSSDGVYYLVLTCDAGTTDPYMSLDVTKN